MANKTKQLIKYFQDALDEHYGFVYDEDKIKVTINERTTSSQMFIDHTFTVIMFATTMNRYYYMERRELEIKDFVIVISQEKKRVLEQCIEYYDKHKEGK